MNEPIEKIWRQFAQNRDRLDLRGRLAEYYLPIVHDAAARISGEFCEKLPAGLRGEISRDDLISAGTLGLLEAVDTFQPESGGAFEPFARRRIRAAIAEDLATLDWVPHALRLKLNRLKEEE